MNCILKIQFLHLFVFIIILLFLVTLQLSQLFIIYTLSVLAEDNTRLCCSVESGVISLFTEAKVKLTCGFIISKVSLVVGKGL